MAALPSRSKSWGPTQVDPFRGEARFDGLIIKADPIDARRADRVMPLFDEEQVLMCRLMRHHLKPGQLVLDVGTGSGVFAIWAAMHGHCRVVAVDISRRAVSFARKNAKTNGLDVATRIESLCNRQLLLQHKDFREYAIQLREAKKRFDMVILNPPFNPTCPGLYPAIHAAAGPTAQAAFRWQIKLVPELLNDRGLCVGYQMSYDTECGEVAALSEVRRAFRERCFIRYVHALDDRIQYPAAQFLRGQYENLIRQADHGASKRKSPFSAERLCAYLSSVGRAGRFFSLIYYEARKKSQAVEMEPRQLRNIAKPNVNWLSRIALHRAIVETASMKRRARRSGTRARFS